MTPDELNVELAGALAGLMREHGELVNLTSSLAKNLQALLEGGFVRGAARRHASELLLAELSVWATDGQARGRQRRAQEALDGYVGRARSIG